VAGRPAWQEGETYDEEVSMRWMSICAVGLVAIALAGCGGSKSASSTTTTTTTETSAGSTTTNASTTTTTAGSTTTEASSTPVFASGKCKDLSAAAAKIGQDVTASSKAGNLEDAAKEFNAFVAVVPSEIKGDVQTIADAFAAYAKAMKGVNLTSGQVPSAADLQKMQAAVKSFNQKKLQVAEQHITAWTTKNCT
jgi:hypothetical protein